MAQAKGIGLVTGASSGIGAAFCRQLVPHCHKLLLVGRREPELQALADELRAAGCEALVILADLSDPLATTRVVEAIRQHGPVTWLVNNAGFGTLGPFDAQTIDSQLGMVAVHINAPLILTRATLPFMREAGAGVVINVSSLITYMPWSGVATYGGSKAFLNNFSEALAIELKDSGIRVQCLVPGYTRTDFHGRDSFSGFEASSVPDSMWMEPDAVAAESLAALDGGPIVFVAGEVNRRMARDALVRQLDKFQS